MTGLLGQSRVASGGRDTGFEENVVAMSSSKKFLVGAAKVASAEGYFRAGEVARAVGFTAIESAQAMRALGERKLVAELHDGQARLRPDGLSLAARLEREAGGQVATIPAGRYGGPGVAGKGAPGGK